MHLSSEAHRACGIVLVDGHPVVRTGLKLLLTNEPDLEVLAEAGDSHEALDALRRVRRMPGTIVIVSLELSGEPDAFWLIREIRERHPTVPILAWGADLDGLEISHALFVGAESFVDKGTPPDRFLEAIRRTAA